jgi:sulfide:quinone oxidoreductase
MKITTLDQQVSVSDQVKPADLKQLAALGVQVLVCNRPDQEVAEQPCVATISKAAAPFDIETIHLPFTAKQMNDTHCDQFLKLLQSKRKIHAYCRTANRSCNLWAAARIKQGKPAGTVMAKAQKSGFDVASMLTARLTDSESIDESIGENRGHHIAKPSYDIVVVGAGSGGISVAASLLKRNRDLRIAVIDPAADHYYQPGWTMVGGGVFQPESTRRKTRELIPHSVTWIQQSVTAFHPDQDKVSLHDGGELYYHHLVVAPGLKLNWDGIEGLSQTLGKNGVTSNYRYDLAPYTWQLAQHLVRGKALFTQPPMPIKCAGAPQKAMYLCADHWFKKHRINDIKVNFYNSAAVLFGVADYIPALLPYIKKYRASLHFSHTLVKICGHTKEAWFKTTNEAGEERLIRTDFDMIHVCPPQCAPDVIRSSELADDTGWLDVDKHTLRHQRFENIWGLGDVMNTPNAKTLAAVRKQSPVVAQNICDTMLGLAPSVGYDGYGSCPLTVERGKIVLAEFAYDGKLTPTFPSWVNRGTTPTQRAWFLKAKMLPFIYWQGMLKGREWLASPKLAFPKQAPPKHGRS